MSMLDRIGARCLAPLMLHPDKLPLVLAVLEGRLSFDIADLISRDGGLDGLPEEVRTAFTGPAQQASRFAGSNLERDPATGAVRQLPYNRADGVAVIPVIGTLINRGAWIGSNSGETSYEGLQVQIAAAAADPNAHAILLDIASPGGEVMGAFETAAAVRVAAAKKPVVAVANSLAASAAYAIASGATRIVTAPTGITGSIGVMRLHVDQSAKLEMAGLKATLLFAGAHKADGNPLGPLPDSVRADWQAEIDAVYSRFLGLVGTHRPALGEKGARATEARTFTASDAVSLGLADSIGTFDEVLAELIAGAPSGRASSAKPKGTRMANHDGASAAEAGITQETLTAAVAAATAQGHAAGLAEGRIAAEAAIAAAVTAERNRIDAIRGAAFEGQEALVAQLITDGASAGEAALKLNADIRTKGGGIAHIKALGAQGIVQPAPNAGADVKPAAGAAKTDEQLKAEFEASGKLQAAYGDAKNYIADWRFEHAGRA